jgi:circadian clock protein KaiB
MNGDAELSATDRFEEALAAVGDERYVLRLYVVGATAASQRAVANLSKLCEEELAGRYTLEVVDISQRPELAAGEQIIAAPTLVRLLPEPMARLVGDMSDRERVLLGLDLRPLPPPDD